MPDTNLIRGFLGSGEEKIGRNLPVAAGMFRVPNPVLDIEPEQPSLPLSHYLWILRRRRWKIMGFVLMTTLGALIVSKRLTPIYESTATVDVDRQTPSGVIGQDAERAAPNDADQFLATQIRLIQSDSVLRPVADRYRLRELEEEQAGASQDDAGLSQDNPVLLKNLRVARPVNTYLLLISYRSPDRRLAADVANAVATSYRDHTYTLRFQSSANLADFMEKQLDELRAKMERSGAALAQFEKELNVIDPEERTSILSARLLQLNTEFTNAQTERVRKETAYRSVSGGALEALQVSSQGEAIKKLTERLDEAQQKFADVAAHYGPNHPEHKRAATQVTEIQGQIQRTRENIIQRVSVEYRDAMSREAMLNQAVAEAKAEFDRINSRSFHYQTLKREAEADKKLYEELITKIKEAGINAGFQNSAIRIADRARPGADAGVSESEAQPGAGADLFHGVGRGRGDREQRARQGGPRPRTGGQDIEHGSSRHASEAQGIARPDSRGRGRSGRKRDGSHAGPWHGAKHPATKKLSGRCATRFCWRISIAACAA